MTAPATMAQRSGEDRAGGCGAIAAGDVRFIVYPATYLTHRGGASERAGLPQRGAGNTAFQSFFMLMTCHPCFVASAISESLKVPMLDFGP